MRTDTLLHLHTNSLQIEPHLLQHIDCYALIKFDQSQQQVFSSHIVVVKPLRLLARKRQDLLGTWSKIIHECISDAGARRLTFWKVDPTSAFLQLTSKPEEIEYCYKVSLDLFTAVLTAKPEVNYPQKGIAVVSASLVNNEFCESVGPDIGRISV
jgi:hypothetical protein